MSSNHIATCSTTHYRFSMFHLIQIMLTVERTFFFTMLPSPVNLSQWHPMLLNHPACFYHLDKRSWRRLHTTHFFYYIYPTFEGPCLRCNMLTWTHYNVLLPFLLSVLLRVGQVLNETVVCDLPRLCVQTSSPVLAGDSVTLVNYFWVA